MLTAAAQLEGPVVDLSFSADTAESYPWRTDLGVAAPMGIRTQRTVVREAVGVVGAITPWNFPHQINLAKIGPALAAGTSCSNRHRHTLVRSNSRRARGRAHGPPARVLNIVTSDDHAVGAMLTRDPRVDMVSFTGSTATGPVGDGRRRADGQPGIPGTRRQVGISWSLDDADSPGRASMAVHRLTHAGRVAPSPQGCWSHENADDDGRGDRRHHGIKPPEIRPNPEPSAVR